MKISEWIVYLLPKTCSDCFAKQKCGKELISRVASLKPKTYNKREREKDSFLHNEYTIYMWCLNNLYIF